MSAQHTPGPWHVGIKQAEQIVYTKNGWAVANATVYHDKQDKDEAKANARLIAEAPAMLVALRGLEMFFKRPDENPVAKFDRIAMAYNRETGNAPPGKSWPPEIDNETPEEKREMFEAWVDGKAEAARAILARIGETA